MTVLKLNGDKLYNAIYGQLRKIVLFATLFLESLTFDLDLQY